MKRNWKIIGQYMPWLLLLLCTDMLGAVLLWLADVQAFHALTAVIFLASVLLFAAVCAGVRYRECKREKAFLSFLNSPDEYQEEELLRAVSAAQADPIRLLGRTLREKQYEYSQAQMELENYQEYVEAWAHEAKMPLSLLLMLLENRREELPGNVGFKLDYIRNRMQESIEQMLFYARVKSTGKDYLFEQADVRACIEEVLEDYRPLLEEKGFQILVLVQECDVYTDRRGLCFILSQVISNAVKYSGEKPEIQIALTRSEDALVLTVRDNGSGVKSCDLPYIFEKGFTGDSGGSKRRATGMGLYLAKEIAEDLNVSLNVKSEWGKGFEMQIAFPIVS